MTENVNQAPALVGLYAQTAIHAGTGQTTGVVDLPIQREGHNGWPCIYGSGLKGALRADAEARGFDKASIDTVFGPPVQPGKEELGFAGALAVSDARLLLLPVRSLTSHFKWVTCPAGLERLQRDARRLDLGNRFGFEVPRIEKENSALVPNGGGALYLEEFCFDAQVADLGKVIASLSLLMHRDDPATALQRQLVVVSDDLFRDLAEHATPVNARVSLDSGTKTVKEGPWYEEVLPPETVLYSALIANRARNGGTQDASGILAAVTNLYRERRWIQVGGNETVGMGWLALQWLAKQEG